MDKAIEILKDGWFFNEEGEVHYNTQDIHEALAELTAHKAKIESLKEWLEKEIKNEDGLNYSDAVMAYRRVTKKLEELGK